jgi:LCP family protein required for cell wall assembly
MTADRNPAAGPDGQPPPAVQNGQPAPSAQSGQAVRNARDGPAGDESQPALNYHAVRRRFQRQIVANRRFRRRRIALLVVGAMSALTLLVSCTGWMVAGYVSSSLARLDAGTSGTPADGPINILVAGVDSRSGLTPRQQAELHVGNVVGANSDTMMLVHIPANHQSVQVVSVPRDSWVNIPGHGMNKINAAYALGGPRLMVSTVEQATGLPVNDYVEVSFTAFVKVIDTLGGVNVCLPYAVDDPYSGLHLSAGLHHVDGVTALKFARDRHSFATSDFARIADQQQLMSSALAEATTSGVVTNPVRLRQVLDSVTAAVKVDNGFNLVELASEMHGISPADVSFTTVPVATVNYQTPTGESAVLWNGPAAARLFQWLQNNTGPAPRARHGRTESAASTTVSGAPGGQQTAQQDACR